MIVSIRRQVHQLKEEELEWAYSKAHKLPEEYVKLLQQFGERFANKLLYRLITGMKGFADDPQKDEMLRVVSALFAMDETVTNRDSTNNIED